MRISRQVRADHRGKVPVREDQWPRVPVWVDQQVKVQVRADQQIQVPVSLDQWPENPVFWPTRGFPALLPGTPPQVPTDQRLFFQGFAAAVFF